MFTRDLLSNVRDRLVLVRFKIIYSDVNNWQLLQLSHVNAFTKHR